jgi:hypothetical protein
VSVVIQKVRELSMQNTAMRSASRCDYYGPLRGTNGIWIQLFVTYNSQVQIPSSELY